MRREKKDLRNGRLTGARVLWCTGALALALVLPAVANAVVLDSVVEDFDNVAADATINGVGSWSVSSGSAANAVVQSSVTATGDGNALKLTGAETPVTVARTTTYGGLTPTWIRFLVQPGLGSESRTGPSQGIAGVTFDFSSKILAADGTTWADTAETFKAGEWWEVIYKLDFTSRTYDLYLSPLANPKISFVPVKTGLDFVDSTKSSMGALKIEGAYSTTLTDDTFLDNLTVTYFERIGFVTAAKTLEVDQPGGPYTVQLQNSLLEPQRAVEDTTLELKSTSTGGTFSLTQEPWGPVTQLLVPKEGTTASFYYKDTKEGKPVLSVKEFPDRGWLEGLQEQKVVETIVRFDVEATSPQTAGAPFAVKLTARDENGDIDKTYNGTVELGVKYVSPGTGTKKVTPTQVEGFSQGKLELQVIYPDAGTIRLTVADLADSERTGESGEILVVPASFKVEANSDKQVVNGPFSVKVTALNQEGAVTPNYAGSVNLSVEALDPATGTGLITPAAIQAASFQAGAGVGSADVTYSRWGEVKISAADVSSPQVTGTSGPIMFHPGALKVTVSAPPSGRAFFYSGESFDVQISVLDANGSEIPNYQGTVTLAADAGLTIPSGLVFLSSHAGKQVLTTSVGTSGKYSVQAKENAAGLASESVEVEIKAALVKVVSTVGQVGGVTEVVIRLEDEEGNLIESENEAQLNVILAEDNPNGSVSSPALRGPIQITQGKAVLILSNAEAELVTITPEGLFGSKVEIGTVSFGKFATRGVGILLWREVEVEEEPEGEEGEE